jgi:hypothetical protein
MENLIEISPQQIQMAFVATCIESVARISQTPYHEVFAKIKSVGMIDKYILPNYELLHTLSRENLAQDIMECLNNWSNHE